jgi:hypothetical protein
METLSIRGQPSRRLRRRWSGNGTGPRQACTGDCEKLTLLRNDKSPGPNPGLLCLYIRGMRKLSSQSNECTAGPGQHSFMSRTIRRRHSPTNGHENAVMPSVRPTPVFYIVQSGDDRWCVETEWPDGTIECIDTFKTYLEAVNWVTALSHEWLRERT